MPAVPRATSYDLSRLLQDQDRVFVEESLPALLTWLPVQGRKQGHSPFDFEVAGGVGARPSLQRLSLTFDLGQLESQIPSLREQVHRWRNGHTLHLERHAELGALGLGLAAIAAFLPGRRVITQNWYAPPDLLIDATPGALRGVEVAGRSTGGRSALRTVAAEKRPRLHRNDIAEAWLSLWCSRPRLAIWMKEKG